ncbi:MAG: fimbrillin family protein [Muribaculaceae bacterium]|nr:fimbrillin family protein [Muribaculaceae bacterium]
MKTNSLILGAAVLMLATACSNDEVVKVAENSQAIGFSSFINNSTRAEDLNTTNLENFYVYGVTTGTTPIAVLFKDQLVEKKGNGEWSYSPEKYWITGNTYTFAAVAPAAVAEVDQSANMNGRGGINNLTFANADGTVDLLYAEETEDNPVVFGQAYTFNFGHILSRVKFEFTNLMAEGYRIEVKAVTIDGTDSKAVYSPSTTSWTAASDNDKEKVYSLVPQDVKAEATGTSTTEPSYLIPTEGARDLNVTFDVNLYFDDADTKEPVLITTEPYKLTATLSGIELKRATSYLFKASITKENLDNTLQPIKFNATVTDWGTDEPVEVPNFEAPQD